MPESADPPKSHWTDCVISATGAAIHEVDNAMLAVLPLDVVEHLQAGRKHLAAAASRVAEIQIAKAEETVKRARDIHERSKQGSESACPSPGDGI